MPKILPAGIFLSLLIALSQIAKPTTDQTDISATQHEGQFRLQESFALDTDSRALLATIYACGEGTRQKEVLSIWSNNQETYELEYIRTAAPGQTFLKPEAFSIEEVEFIKITTGNHQSGKLQIETILSVQPYSGLHEVDPGHSRELIKIYARKS
jgi:hypothetical protein